MLTKFKKLLNYKNLFVFYPRKVYRKIYKVTHSKIYTIIYNFLNTETPVSRDIKYRQWLFENYPRKADLNKMLETVNVLRYKPIISIIVPVYNTPEHFLREAIESVLCQVYPHWELCICDDASSSSRVREVLSEYAAKDTRIKIAIHTTNQHISHTSNSAIAIASGEFVSLLDHDDLITPDALYEIVLLLNQHPEADMIYSDEDKILPDRSLDGVFFKPDWCPDSFLARMYICHLGTYRLSLIREIGGFRPGYEGSQDYDLVLRLTEKTDKIFHIPKVLYHWRIHPESTAGGMEAKPYAANAAKLALNDAISRRREDGVVTSVSGFDGCYTVRYKTTNYKLVSIIVVADDSNTDLDRCLKSIFGQSLYPNYEVILLNNGVQNRDVLKAIDYWREKEPNRCKVFSPNVSLKYSDLNNYGVSKASGDYILFLDSSAEITMTGWIEALVEQIQRDSIGAAGALLLNPDDTIYHAGIIVGYQGLIGYPYQGLPSMSAGYFGSVQTINNYSALSISCLICRRDVFERVGGFSQEVSGELAGVDICLKMLEQSYRNIYLPHVRLYRHRSKNDALSFTTAETNYFQKRWQSWIDRDPCYSPRLTLQGECYEINTSLPDAFKLFNS